MASRKIVTVDKNNKLPDSIGVGPSSEVLKAIGSNGGSVDIPVYFKDDDSRVENVDRVSILVTSPRPEYVQPSEWDMVQAIDLSQSIGGGGVGPIEFEVQQTTPAPSYAPVVPRPHFFVTVGTQAPTVSIDEEEFASYDYQEKTINVGGTDLVMTLRKFDRRDTPSVTFSIPEGMQYYSKSFEPSQPMSNRPFYYGSVTPEDDATTVISGEEYKYISYQTGISEVYYGVPFGVVMVKSSIMQTFDTWDESRFWEPVGSTVKSINGESYFLMVNKQFDGFIGGISPVKSDMLASEDSAIVTGNYYFAADDAYFIPRDELSGYYSIQLISPPSIKPPS